MTKPELIERIAALGHTTPAAAADRLDEIVFSILKKLKEGKPAAIPGLGRLSEPAQTTARKAK